MENLNPMFIKEIEFVIKQLPTNKTPGPCSFSGELFQTYKEITSILHKCFQKIEY